MAKYPFQYGGQPQLMRPRRHYFGDPSAPPQSQGAAGPIPTPSAPPKQYVEDFFINEMDVLALAAGASTITNLQIDASSDFKWTKIGMVADIAAAAQTASSAVVPLVTLQINDSAAGRNLFSNPVPIAAFIGNGQLPFILPVPRFFAARSNIQFTWANYSAATTYNLRVALLGAKIFAQGGEQG